MDANQTLLYLDRQSEAIEDLVEQLDEIQTAFNAQFDTFKAQHDVKLDTLSERVFGQLVRGEEESSAIPAGLCSAIDNQTPQESQLIDERRNRVRQEYLPLRQQEANETLAQAQAQLAELRALNPELDEREEALKEEKGALEARLTELNQEIGDKARGLGVVRHFRSMLSADRERQRILGQLDVINATLHKVRREWQRKRTEVAADQENLQERWQLQSIAVARLQSELDQLDDSERRGSLALQRAITHVLDEIKEPLAGPDPDLDLALAEMVELNIQTDTYHEALAAIGGFIGLLRGIKGGLGAIRKSIEGLEQEQRMHSAHLPALKFSISDSVQTFHQQWPALAQQFADEEVHGRDPAGFATAIQPLLDGPLSQPNVEAMFNSLGATIETATEPWG